MTTSQEGVPGVIAKTEPLKPALPGGPSLFLQLGCALPCCHICSPLCIWYGEMPPRIAQAASWGDILSSALLQQSTSPLCML